MVRTTSLWKAFALNSEPGLGAMNRHLASPHELQRLEGITQYYGPAYNTMPIRGRNLASAGAGFQDIVMKNRYDATTQGAMQRDGWVEAQDRHRRLYGDSFQLRPIPREGDPGTVSTQAAASRHRLEQRYMGSGYYDHSTDIRSDTGSVFLDDPEDYIFGQSDMRASDAMLESAGWKRDRRQEAKRLVSNGCGDRGCRRRQPNFTSSNDFTDHPTQSVSEDRSAKVITIDMSRLHPAIIIVSAGLFVLLLCFAIKGIFDVLSD